MGVRTTPTNKEGTSELQGNKKKNAVRVSRDTKRGAVREPGNLTSQINNLL